MASALQVLPSSGLLHAPPLASAAPGGRSSPSSAWRPVSTNEAARCQAVSRAPMRRSRRAASSWPSRASTCEQPVVPPENRSSTAPTRWAISSRSSPTTLWMRSPISMRNSASSSPTQAASATCSALPMTAPEVAFCAAPVTTLALSPTSSEGPLLRDATSSEDRRSARSAAWAASSTRRLRSARAAQRSERSRERSWVRCPMDRLASSRAARQEERPPWAVPSTDRIWESRSSESLWSKRETSFRISADSCCICSCEHAMPSACPPAASSSLAATRCCSSSSLASLTISRCAPLATACVRSRATRRVSSSSLSAALAVGLAVACVEIAAMSRQETSRAPTRASRAARAACEGSALPPRRSSSNLLSMVSKRLPTKVR
mmetsp:Transcript_123677/g.361157  ORF Transcript_123677/g.361157 Transcript_123677/m.361157 type:complete len:378 (-) Transcript_123677:950-2083(-)